MTALGQEPEDVLSAGYKYFLEVSIALEEVFGQPGIRLCSEQRLVAVIYCAEKDAYSE